jgi:serine/threonine protein kinase
MQDDLPTQRFDPDSRETVRVPPARKDVVFGRYEMVSLLGVGGMGEVWLTRDTKFGNQELAIKFLKGELASDPKAREDLQNEVRNNRALSHKNIMKAYQFESDEAASEIVRRYAISMEYVKGLPMNKLMAKRGGWFEVEHIKGWVIQLCDAMQHAHEARDDKGQKRPVVHRDLKPANMMIHENGDLKVCDFGIGCTVEETMSRLTNQIAPAGTLAYMSPDQLRGKAPSASHDIYSIGATIYELITGKPPFFRGNSPALIEQIKSETAPSMTDRRKEEGFTGRDYKQIPVEWEKAVASCLAKLPEERPASVKDLRELLEGKPAVVKKPPSPSKLKWLALAAAILLAAGLGGYMYWKSQIQLLPPVLAMEKAAKITPDEANLLNQTLRGPDGYEKSLAARMVADDGKLPVENWRNYSGLVPAKSDAVAKLRPLLQTGSIHEQEFPGLLDDLAGANGDSAKDLASRLVNDKSISADDWRIARKPDPLVANIKLLTESGAVKPAESAMLLAALAGSNGKDELLSAQKLAKGETTVDQWRAAHGKVAPVDPFFARVQPLVKSKLVTTKEGKWLRDALAGEKNDNEKILAGRLVDEKSITPGVWRAKTALSYLLGDDEVIDPANPPPAIDLPLNETTNVRLLRIDPGSFIHGSPKEELGRKTNEMPQEMVKIDTILYLGMYEVTQAQYTSIMPRNPSYWRKHPNWPIDQVNWQDVQGPNGFMTRLNHILSTKYGGSLVADLPTEDEWEYACRAGTDTSFNNGKNITNITSDESLDLLANYNRADEGSPMPVGSFQPNDWGLYDMHGNVEEWTRDRFLRGGSWHATAVNCRVGWRTQKSMDSSPSNEDGFRLALRLKGDVPKE